MCLRLHRWCASMYYFSLVSGFIDPATNTALHRHTHTHTYTYPHLAITSMWNSCGLRLFFKICLFGLGGVHTHTYGVFNSPCLPVCKWAVTHHTYIFVYSMRCANSFLSVSLIAFPAFAVLGIFRLVGITSAEAIHTYLYTCIRLT